MRMSKARAPPGAHESMASGTKCVMRKPAVRGGGKRGRTRNHGDRRHVLCEEHVKAGQLTLCTAKLRDVPHTPGVYVMRDRLNCVIYVGKARDLRKRLANYFTPARSKHADRKTRALIDSIWDFDLQHVRNDTEALVLKAG